MMSAELPWSQACENNKRPILEVLQRYLPESATMLEIGSGTGQHASFFAAEMPHLIWQTSDLAANHPGIRGRIAMAGLANIRPPLDLDVGDADWGLATADAVFSANTAHIMGWPAVCAMIAGVGRLLPPGGRFLLYGPFNYGGRHTSESNARFDLSLRMSNPVMGIRDFEQIAGEAAAAGLELEEDCEMPANNRVLVWQR